MQRSGITLRGDQLDARYIRMVACDLVEQQREKLPPDSLALRFRMDCDSEVTQNVSEETQLAAVRVQLRSQSRQARHLRNHENSPLQTSGNESIHVIAVTSPGERAIAPGVAATA